MRTKAQGWRDRWLFLGIVLVFGINGCTRTRSIEPYYSTGADSDRDTLEDLFGLLAAQPPAGEGRFVVMREIGNIYIRLEEYGKLIAFLSAQVQANPDDPYDTYYLFMIAYGYTRQQASPVATLYFDLILKNYPDMRIEGKSVHQECLKQLIALEHNPERQVRYYQELIARFPDEKTLGRNYFLLGQAYERIGEWDDAIQSYTEFLRHRETTIIPGFPNADTYAKQLVDFNKSPRDWTFESLAALVSAIKSALDQRSRAQLQRYQAKVNFFARSWGEQETDDAGMTNFNLSLFMNDGSQIRYAAALDPGSNANEAYLRTSGWELISVWYLYFRKIYFPLDPEIHGRWEWAGVFYGEKF